MTNLVLILLWAVIGELAGIVILIAALRITVLELKQHEPIRPVEIDPRDEISIEDIRREEAYRNLMEIPEDDRP